MKRQNKKDLEIDQEFINRIKKQISEASKFQYDKAQINEMVFKTNCDKIKRGNYKGLNMTDFRISLLGQVSIAESDIREWKELNQDRVVSDECK